MLCNYCHGKHVVFIGGNWQPCEECGGMGEIHCCDGLMAQPEPIALFSESSSLDCAFPEDSQAILCLENA